MRKAVIEIKKCEDCPYVGNIMDGCLDCTHPDLPEGTVEIENEKEIPEWCPLIQDVRYEENKMFLVW